MDLNKLYIKSDGKTLFTPGCDYGKAPEIYSRVGNFAVIKFHGSNYWGGRLTGQVYSPTEYKLIYAQWEGTAYFKILRTIRVIKPGRKTSEIKALVAEMQVLEENNYGAQIEAHIYAKEQEKKIRISARELSDSREMYNLFAKAGTLLALDDEGDKEDLVLQAVRFHRANRSIS